MVPARVKFARFRSVQKCTLFVFRPQFESLPSKIFLSENIFIGKIRFPFHWFHFKNLSTNRLAVTGWKLKADLTKKCFFLFFNLSEIKRLFSLCNKEIFNFCEKIFFRFQSIILIFSGAAFDHPRQTRQYVTFDWDQLRNSFWRRFFHLFFRERYRCSTRIKCKTWKI